MRKIFILTVSFLLPLLVLAQNGAKKKAYYFFGENCPHCKNVEEYFQKNGIYDKYEITKLEVVANPFNGKLFLEFGKAFGVEDWGGVPAIVFENKYLVGDTPIIENFEKEIAGVEAKELPDPEKIGKNDAVSKNNPDNSSPGNKKNYFPVIIGVAVVLSAGILVWVNCKK